MNQSIKNINKEIEVGTTHKVCTHCRAKYNPHKKCYVCTDTGKELTNEGVELVKLKNKLDEHFKKYPFTPVAC